VLLLQPTLFVHSPSSLISPELYFWISIPGALNLPMHNSPGFGESHDSLIKKNVDE
jgi:hypothetical protein